MYIITIIYPRETFWLLELGYSHCTIQRGGKDPTHGVHPLLLLAALNTDCGFCFRWIAAHWSISQGKLNSYKTPDTNIHAMACFTSKGSAGCLGQIHCHQGREKGPGDMGTLTAKTTHI